ncbi:hypothetical protein PPL_02813 [Heterostelium album PN500]|uniref:Uncharacterized protein n=1 Tax=Heterostelium pallidum (strain ATCC 26659 / Pp 5 / PN500) TaxID=670386 RepID=D3B348_HETP5|nr:hypothetical protein PPL_02813 [Heterostelium album PN500]EFA83746.1 hypothetical protein PPL_02813 [Heterostelium album PN500]|eukprot:XP_020435863.1 hypothetical protein PPL_02813 [Heterostelium album PN500]
MLQPPSPSAPNITDSLLYNINELQQLQRDQEQQQHHQHYLQLTLSPLVDSCNSNNNNHLVLYNNNNNQCYFNNSKLILYDTFVKVAQYRITSQEAAHAFETWKQRPETNKIYIPFYCFHSTYTVNFQGLVYYQNGGTEITMNGSGGISNIDPAKRQPQQQQQQLVVATPKGGNHVNKSLERGSIRRTIAKIFLCGSSMDDWKDYQDIRVFFDFNRVDQMTMSEFKEKCQFQHARESSRLSHDSVWANHISKIQVDEQSNAASYLCSQEQTATVENVSSDIEFDQTVATLFYVPFYHHSYVFDNKHYSFFIDGQSGQIFATRPEVGLGKLGDLVKGVKNYFGMYLWQEQIQRKRGSELNIEDNVDVYAKENYFIMWPRSANGLLSGNLQGWLTIRNRSNRPITFRGQKRRGYTKGNPITLQPRAEQSYSYKGHWCMEVIDGDYQNLEIIHLNTSENNRFPNIGFA